MIIEFSLSFWKKTNETPLHLYTCTFLYLYWNYVRYHYIYMRHKRDNKIFAGMPYKYTNTTAHHTITIIMTKNHNAVRTHDPSYWFTKVKTIDWFCRAFVWYEFRNRLYEIYYGDNLRPTLLVSVHIDITRRQMAFSWERIGKLAMKDEHTNATSFTYVL